MKFGVHGRGDARGGSLARRRSAGPFERGLVAVVASMGVTCCFFGAAEVGLAVVAFVVAASLLDDV